MLIGQGLVRAADGKHPVALTGRVYCQVDARYGAIRSGDLLTTSWTRPATRLKVTNHARAHGAIIGKAMTRLESGKGLVLVLVSLTITRASQNHSPSTSTGRYQNENRDRFDLWSPPQAFSAQTYTSSWSAFDSGVASSQSSGRGAPWRSWIMGVPSTPKRQLRNRGATSFHANSLIPGQAPSLRISLVGNDVRVPSWAASASTFGP